MRRTLVVLALSGLLATVVGSAAALNVNGGAVQAGNVSATCDSDGVNVAWGLETDDSTVRYVRIEGIDAACEGADLFVKIFDTNSPAVLLYYSGVVAITGTSVQLSFASPYLSAAAIGQTNVWISD